MKKIITISSIILLITVAACAKSEKLNSLNEKFSYSIGINFGKYIQNIEKQTGEKVNRKIFMQAINDVLDDSKLLLTEEEQAEIGKIMQEKEQKQKGKIAMENKEKGEKFLAENKKNKSVVTTDSGLQYIVLKEGTGEKPKATDQVEVHYKGTTIDGKEFDSSYKRNSTAKFPLNQVIKGWTEGVQLMKVGAKYKFFIPSELAYGERGAGASIGPNETLIFEVELISIAK